MPKKFGKENAIFPKFYRPSTNYALVLLHLAVNLNRFLTVNLIRYKNVFNKNLVKTKKKRNKTKEIITFDQCQSLYFCHKFMERTKKKLSPSIDLKFLSSFYDSWGKFNQILLYLPTCAFFFEKGRGNLKGVKEHEAISPTSPFSAPLVKIITFLLLFFF